MAVTPSGCSSSQPTRQPAEPPSGNLQYQFAVVATTEELHERGIGVLEPLLDMLINSQLPGRDPARNLGAALGKACYVVQDQKAVQGRPLHNDLPQIARTQFAAVTVVFAD